MRGVFVTGTGTEVGKTVVAALIARTLVAEGRSVAVFKPAVTGLDEEGEPDHALLRRAAGSGQSDDEIAPYRYGPPASPHLAAALADEKIDRERLLSTARTAAASAETIVCEGVGGLLAPLACHVSRPIAEKRDETYLVRDFAGDLGLPLVIAASSGLGTINHTLLTLEAARGAGLEVEYVVLTPWPDNPTAIEESNRATIAALGEVRVETLPRLDLSDPQAWPRLPAPLPPD